MNVIAGCIIVRDNKILMVKEAQKECYGQWNYPAGKVDEFEKITDAAIRETYEETGCKVKLTGVLPISAMDFENRTDILIKFTAEILEESIHFNTDEILDVKWIDINEIKNMKEEELRGYDNSIEILKFVEENKVYPLKIFDDRKYTSK